MFITNGAFIALDSPPNPTTFSSSSINANISTHATNQFPYNSSHYQHIPNYNYHQQQCSISPPHLQSTNNLTTTNSHSSTYINNHHQSQYSSSHPVETFHTFKILHESINGYFESSQKLTNNLKEQIQAFSLSFKASHPEAVEKDQEDLPDLYKTQLHHLNLMPTQVDVYEDEEKSKMHALEENQQENLLQNLFPTNHTLTLCDSDFVPCLTVAKSETPPFPSKSSLLIFNLEYTFLKFGIGVVASFNIGRDWLGFCYAAPISCNGQNTPCSLKIPSEIPSNWRRPPPEPPPSFDFIHYFTF